MKFTKMQGLGNDYVYVNCFEKKIKNPEAMARKVSNRNFGVGSDGLILICPSETADFRMDMYNADGSRAEMCGNGIRCVGKYVYDYGLTDKTEIKVETLAVIKELNMFVSDGKVSQVEVNMGEPILTPSMIPVKTSIDPPVNVPIEIRGRQVHMTCVSMGNPHAVVFLDHSVKDLDIETVGPEFENHIMFPRRVNTEFVQVLDRTRAEMRVWERGSGETMACGTGACATAVAAILADRCDNSVELQLLGGSLQIEYDREADRVYMTGPATTVYDGEISLPDAYERDDVRIYEIKS